MSKRVTCTCVCMRESKISLSTYVYTKLPQLYSTAVVLLHGKSYFRPRPLTSKALPPSPLPLFLSLFILFSGFSIIILIILSSM
ncbi:hypothetical protein CXB51_033006 [Gossypium anomalum]|uniref:Transmembrane protein n=1 Tax=Gossypium anomalum TaxID=47600 RepID=A0A8J5XW40_9ROSI|nr:hypothetical protein CXB51_033006 [Gossypium anomalum]